MISVQSFLNIFTRKPVVAGTPKATFIEIDNSMRVSGVFFVACAIFWLMVGTVFALIASISLHAPEFFPNWEWLTFGRVRSAHLNAMAFGWSNNAIYAVGIWVMVRLNQEKIYNPFLLITAGVFWNIAIVIGVTGILLGQVTSVEWLEMPQYISPVIALSYILIGVWAILSFRYRRSEHVYVSQWYLLMAFFCFPWLYTVAQTMIIWVPARGTVQALANWWFAHNILGLWYTPVGLGIAYYLIPKVLGRPIHSYYLSVIGFWTLALFYNWAGIHHLIGGPVPVWLISSAIVASIMMVIPVLVTAINHHMTVVGHFKAVWQSPTLRFIVFGAMSYTLASAFGSAMALREVNVVTHFTHFTVGHAHHGVYAFFTMTLFGGIYYMMPRLINREWPSAMLIRVHFWCVGVGIAIYVVGLSIGGWIQGLEMNDPDIPFLEIVKHTVPWLMSRSVAGSLMALGHIAFAIHFLWMLFSKKQQEGPTLLTSSQEDQGGSIGL